MYAVVVRVTIHKVDRTRNVLNNQLCRRFRARPVSRRATGRGGPAAGRRTGSR